MSKNKLLSCPFCGRNVAEIINAKDLEYCKRFEDEECDCYEDDSNPCRLWTVVCNYLNGGCGATSGWFSDKEKAIERWNTRGKSWR